MIVVDASCLYEVLIDAPDAEAIRARLVADDAHAAPHVIDIEVAGLIRRDVACGLVDPLIGELAMEDLRAWPAERFGHRGLLERIWELRHAVRTWDAAYVALAEVLGATLLTRDERLGRAVGPTCAIEVI